MVQIPDEFLRISCDNIGVELPGAGEYAAGMLFLPKEPALRYQCEGILERIAEEEELRVLGWRSVPTDSRVLGETARGTEPVIRQVFINKGKLTEKEFEKRLYILRKRTENGVNKLVKRNSEYFYISSLSSKTMVYKGLLLPEQIGEFYLDLNDFNFKSAIALVHQRFSTNTFPTWDLAQPFRYLAHNGEINTIRGNRNWMNDRSNIHSMMMLIPEAWENDKTMTEYKKAFYEYHASMLEPWDGPATVFFTDGVKVGATLDRNGLRPAKYVITKNNIIVMASEMGVLKFKPEDILKKKFALANLMKN